MLSSQSKKSSMHPTTNKILKILGIVFALLYPIFVFFMLKNGLSLRLIALLLVVLVLSSFLRSKQKTLLFVGLALIFGLFFSNDELFLRLYPVCMNFFVCMSFAMSLYEKPLITVFAEKMGHEATKEMQSYTKKATIAWAVFMGINTFISILTLFASLWIWTLYNGLISYVLIGIMFGAEYLIRRRCM